MSTGNAVERVGKAPCDLCAHRGMCDAGLQPGQTSSGWEPHPQPSRQDPVRGGASYHCGCQGEAWQWHGLVPPPLPGGQGVPHLVSHSSAVFPPTLRPTHWAMELAPAWSWSSTAAAPHPTVETEIYADTFPSYPTCASSAHCLCPLCPSHTSPVPTPPLPHISTLFPTHWGVGVCEWGHMSITLVPPPSKNKSPKLNKMQKLNRLGETYAT